MRKVVQVSLRRKIAFPLFILFLMLCYGAYLQITFIDANKTAQKEWQSLRGSIAEREEGSKTLEKVVKSFLESRPSAADEEDQGKRDALEKSVAEMRDATAKLAGAQSPSAAADADFILSQKFVDFFKAAEPFQELRDAFDYRSALEDLSAAQTNLTDARCRYNAAVSTINAKITTFPGPFVVPIFHLEPLEYFNALDPEEKERLAKKAAKDKE